MKALYPKISIVSPSFNQGHFIEEAIKSVIDQDYPNYEHIIIDGGSTDNTLEILNKYPHLVWVSERDEGQSDALNKGFRMATGDIIGWLNIDDLYLPGTFMAVAEAFKENDIDAVYSNYRIVDGALKIQRELITQNASKWMSLFYCHVPSATLFFRKSIIDNGIDIDRKFDISMDMEFVAHLIFSGYRIKKVDSFFAHFRRHETNKSNDTAAVKKVRLKEGIEIFNRYSGLRLPDNQIGHLIYHSLDRYCEFYRALSRPLKIGIYSYRKMIRRQQVLQTKFNYPRLNR